MRDPFYGAIEEYFPTDYIVGGEMNIPVTTSTFPAHQIQYNQNQIAANSCTIHGAITAISNLVNHTYAMVERQDLWRKALGEGASNEWGWYIGKACDLARREWNATHSDNELMYYRIRLDNHESVLPKGYMLVTGFKGNANYNADVNADGVLDLVNLVGVSTYGHCITIYKSGDEYVVDNYVGGAHNQYRIKDLDALIKNNVFFNEAYFFVPKNALVAQEKLPGVSEWAKEAVQWCIDNKIAMRWEAPQQIIADAVTEKMLFNAGLLKSYTGLGVSKERMAVVLFKTKKA